MTDNDWYYSPDHRQVCRVIETQSLWGESICRVWLPGHDSVVRIPAARLLPLEQAGNGTPESIAYTTAAARVADTLASDVLLAPASSTVIPLPHQLRALSRVISGDRIRYLLADEVGLGKTIEAGLILRELKMRGLVNRTLVIAPRGLVTQWVSEMRFHFGENFQLVLPDDIRTLNRIAPETASPSVTDGKTGPRAIPANAWQMFSQVVVPMDSVKPLDKRRGWSPDQVGEYNRERFEDLVSAGWELVIVDEAHRLGGSTDQVARFKLGQGLSEASPYLLLLTATPHQGKTEAFHRLVSLLDARQFPDVNSVTRERVQPYVIRTEKRRAINAEGKPLFTPRHTQLAPVSWEERHHDQQLLYKAVTNYVRWGYNQARREKRNYIGFLMILMQRLVVSSTNAIRTALEKRLEALATPPEQATLFSLTEEELADMDGQELADTLLDSRFFRALKNERAEIERVLETAARCTQSGPDTKAEALLDWLYRLQSEEGEPEMKALIFTEFVPTQQMLRRFLTERGFSVVCLNGSMDMDERRRAQETFARDARILVSTDAGGEGLNLQFCHVVINYDIPWNPMRLEQRIGRVDRIGQNHPVQAVNFVFQDSVEHRVREVLEEKLAVILEEFGADKTGDVLDSAQAGEVFNEAYIEAILNPEKIEETVDEVVGRLKEQTLETRTAAAALGTTDNLDPAEAQRLLAHPLPYWVERMTVTYLKAHGGRAEKKKRGWRLAWPDGTVVENAVFTLREAEKIPEARHLTLEDPRVRGLVARLPRFVPGQPIPVVSIPDVPDEIRGTWSLWRITIAADDWNRRSIMPLFLADTGSVYLPAARHIWDQLILRDAKIVNELTPEDSFRILEKTQVTAHEQGKAVYDNLVQEHREHLVRELEKAGYAFSARRKAIERIGLPQVRDHRLTLLAREEKDFHEQLDRRAGAWPEMTALLVLRVEGGNHG